MTTTKKQKRQRAFSRFVQWLFEPRFSIATVGCGTFIIGVACFCLGFAFVVSFSGEF
jgi:hypothetical protein